MFKRKFKRGFSAAVMAVAIVSFAACDDEKEVALNAGMPAQRNAADASEMMSRATAESRHFDVYNSYRMLFDEAADANLFLTQDDEEGLRPAVVTFSASNIDELRACSIRMLLTD